MTEKKKLRQKFMHMIKLHFWDTLKSANMQISIQSWWLGLLEHQLYYVHSKIPLGYWDFPIIQLITAKLQLVCMFLYYKYFLNN